MFGDAPVPGEAVEEEGLRRPVERTCRIGPYRAQVLEQFNLSGQDAIPRVATPQWLSQEQMCKPPIQPRTRSII